MHEDDPFDRLEQAAELVMARAETASQRMVYERANRLGLLWVHAFVGITAGVQQLLWGTAPTIETLFGPGARLITAPIGLVGGFVLALGLTHRPRNIGAEAVGLALVSVWDLAMTLGLAYARLKQADYRFIGMHEPLPPGYVSAYPITVYGGMFALLLVHLWTLRHVRHQLGGLRGS